MDDKPRPKAPTLVGIGPAEAVVVGAVGRLELPSTHSVETQRMIFEPGAQEAGHDVEPVSSKAAEEAFAPVPLPTPSPSPASTEPPPETPILPPVAPVSEPFELVRASTSITAPPPFATPAPDRPQSPVIAPQLLPDLPPRSRARGRVVTGMLVVVAVLAAVAVQRGLKKSHASAPSLRSAATLVEPPTATPTPTATSTPTPTSTPTATSTSTTPTSSPLAPFNSYTAKRALEATGHEVAKCRRGKVSGIALATVTFVNDGSVAERVISSPFAGTPTGACVADALAEAHVAPFTGKPGVLVHRFYVAP
jgi:hypothetical protein